MQKMELVDIFKKRTRHPMRPRSSDIIERIFPDFKAIEGTGGSLVAGTCTFHDKDLYIIGQQKPKPADLKSQADLNKRNYGMLTSDDHSLILSILKKARLRDPDDTYIFCMVDTYGADISMDSAQHFQAFFIAQLIKEFLTIPLRTISLVLGEGGSGGALAIQFTDIRGQMDDALYATAPPESMASIIFRDATRINDALTILKPTARELKGLDVIDRIVPTPDDVTDSQEISENIEHFLAKAVKDLSRVRISRLLKKRAARARKYGVNKETGAFHEFKRYLEKPIKKFF
ncbi:MAG: acetyl-CoA carboxylase carboxyl transferase subunit alpha/beta, partial [Deltaproteobacteria bacterium]|nr:acetyl-CoA carboxylase carboxyl transferase subunit alpha/beta [Deltaproteobacteria bacterium]